jgi:hypothetical protein
MQKRRIMASRLLKDEENMGTHLKYAVLPILASETALIDILTV